MPIEQETAKKAQNDNDHDCNEGIEDETILKVKTIHGFTFANSCRRRPTVKKIATMTGLLSIRSPADSEATSPHLVTGGYFSRTLAPCTHQCQSVNDMF
jgi:hypothetical protein